MKATAIPSLEGLDNLGRRNGVDIRPTLVRVLTDLYVQKPLHTSEEEQHYTELVLRLIDAVDISTRAIVARKLANYAAAPAKVVRRLARDVPEVAEPVLANSPCLSSLELLEIIGEFGPGYAAMIARRGAFGANNASANPGAQHLATARTTTSVDTAAADGAPPAARSEADIRLGELFFVANREERRVILSNLGGGSGHAPPSRPWTAGADGAIQRLEAHAMGHCPEAFAAEIEGALGISEETARRTIADPSGEPLLVALKALGMPSDVVLRVLLFLDPAVGHSVDRVFDLARLYDQIAPEAAIRIVSSLREITRGRPQAPVHQPVHAVEETERVGRTAMDAARRQVGPAPGFSQREAPATGRVTAPRDRAGGRRGDPRLQ